MGYMTDDNFIKTIKGQSDMTEEDQMSAGAPIAGSVEEEHMNFAGLLISLIDEGKINPLDTQTFLNHDIYNALDEEWQDKTDMVMANIAGQIRLIDAFLKDPNNPKESPQLQTMIEQLWQMKQTIEAKGKEFDVFIF